MVDQVPDANVSDADLSVPAHLPGKRLPALRAQTIADVATPEPSPTPIVVERVRNDALLRPELKTAPSKTIDEPDAKKRIRHNGFVASVNTGIMGCNGKVCRQSHTSEPGFRIDGFIGGNVSGFLELGITGGWGKLSSSVKQGTNALGLYGIAITPTANVAALALGFDVNTLAVHQTETNALQIGPQMRVHLIPWGRMGLYGGAGVVYDRYRNDYLTSSGNLRIDFHGFAVPFHGGIDAYINEYIAVGAQYGYLWSNHLIAVIDHPQQLVAVPVPMLNELLDGRTDLSQLPHFWTATAGIRLNI